MVGGGGAHVRGGLRLGERDFRLCLLGAAGDEFVHSNGRVVRQRSGLGARVGDDRGGGGLRLGGFLLEAREQRDRFRTQFGGLREFVGDRLAARVETFQDRAMDAEIAEQAKENDEAGQNEKLSAEFHLQAPVPRDFVVSTALAITPESAARPIRRSTIAAVASFAISATFDIACARVAAICASAAASLAANSSSSALRLASASAASLSRVA